MKTDFDDEVLVAYLDGELDAQKTQEIETSLSEQPGLRERLLKLRMTWDLLEDLPASEPSQQFAASTMEMVAMSMDESPSNWRGWLAKNSSLLMLLSIPTLFLLGFLATKYQYSRLDRHLLRDLPLLVDWKSLSNIDSIEWLEVLGSEVDLIEASRNEQLNLVGGGSLPLAIGERREWLSSLSDVDRSRLNSNRNELQQKELERQNQLRSIAAHIYAEPETTARYLSAIRAYELLLQEQSLTLRASLNDMPINERRIELKHLVSWRLAENYGRNLSSSDISAIRDWADELQIKYIDSIATYPEGAVTSVYYNWFLPDSVILAEDFDNLSEQLSPRAQAIIGGLLDGESRMRAMMTWISSIAFPRELNSQEIAPDQIKELYMKLPTTLTDTIDLMPTEEAKRKVRELAKAPIQIKEGVQPTSPRRE